MWDTFVLDPMTNFLLLLYSLLNNNFFFAIAIFTLFVRLIMLPLNIRSQRSQIRMQELQPKIQAIQKKHRDNPQKMQEEFRKIGYNPAETLSGCFPLVLQMPIFIGLYQAINLLLGSSPKSVFELVNRSYGWVDLSNVLPIANKFWWLNLAQPDPRYILPILVFGTMFLQQKLIMPKPKKDGNDDNPMAQMTQTMQYTMPLMIGFFALSFPAGLSLYFVISNLVGMVQGLIMRRNREALQVESDARQKAAALASKSSEQSDDVAADETEASSNGKSKKQQKKLRQQTNKKKRRARR